MAQSKHTRWAWFGAVVLLIAAGAGAAAWAALTPGPIRAISLRSEPSGASAYLGSRYVGRTPVELRRGEAGSALVRIEKPGYFTRRQWVQFGRMPNRLAAVFGRQPTGTADVSLRLMPKPTATLTITSEPARISVYLDGKCRGVTPLTMSDVEAEEHAIRLEAHGYATWKTTRNLAPGEKARIHHVMISDAIQLYLDKTAKDPKDLRSFAELGHHYVLAGRFDAAKKAFERAYQIAGDSTTEIPDTRRFYQQLWNVYTRQYKYPPETKDSKIREACKALLKKAYDRDPYDRTIQRFWTRVQKFGG